MQRIYYDSGILKLEVFMINGKKMVNVKNIMKMEKYVILRHI